VTRVQPERLRSVEVGFRALEDGGPEAQTWASAHGQGTERRPAEGLMMTGDGNLVEVQIRVFFTLAEPRVYLFEVVEPDEVLRALTEAVVRQVLAERAFLPLFTSQREAFQQEVTARLQARLAEPAYRLGLAVQSVAFQDLHPPQELVDAYYDVTKALTRKDRVITEERTRRDTAISREEVARQRVRAEAQAAADALTTRTAAERDAFRALVAVQRAERWAGLVLPAPGPAAPWQVAQTTWTAAQRAERADLPRQLVEFRLYLEAAEAVLAGRPKILRDPAIRGALTVLPDLFKLRLPPLGRDREAMPPRAGHGEGP
jgi:regulator of protease activity HflC (stomatin/prohibitin superfamily)